MYIIILKHDIVMYKYMLTSSLFIKMYFFPFIFLVYVNMYLFHTLLGKIKH